MEKSVFLDSVTSDWGGSRENLGSSKEERFPQNDRILSGFALTETHEDKMEKIEYMFIHFLQISCFL